MERFSGWLYDAGSSRRQPVTVQADARGQVELDGSAAGPWSGIQVSDRVGNIPRRLTLPDRRVIETLDNDAVDRLEARFAPKSAASFLHRLEKHWRPAALAVLTACLIGWLTVGYGVPWASRAIASALPQSVLELTSEQTLATLDRMAFSPSKLSADRQADVEALLKRAGAVAGGGYTYRLALRDGGEVGANAFALPDGTILVTDQLVRLAANDDQILAVIAHEIGHVQKRHGMRRIVESSVMTGLAMFVLGDVSQAISSMPVFLLKSAYSRDFEREADAYGVSLLEKMGVPPDNLSAFLERLEESQKGGTPPGWLSTHPPTPERLKAIRELQKGRSI